MSRAKRWTEEELRRAAADATSYSDLLRTFGLRAAGGNFASLKRDLTGWGIATEHFTFSPTPTTSRKTAPLEQVLVEHSTATRRTVKRLLYGHGLRERSCALCGIGELWRGLPMTLILDHVNGVHDDNRLENLRIVCPNCNATLDTHCGRKLARPARSCEHCDDEFVPTTDRQRFCSRACGVRHARSVTPQPSARRVERPPLPQLLAEVEALGWSAVGRRYGVSDNAVRKWVRTEQRRAALAPASTAGQREPD